MVKEAYDSYVEQSRGKDKVIPPTKVDLARRVKTLIDYKRKEELESLRKSGCDEDYADKEQLLTELIEMIDNLEVTRKEKKAKEIKLDIEGGKIREAAILNLNCSPPSTPTPSSAKSVNQRKSNLHMQMLELDRQSLKLQSQQHEEDIKIRKEELEVRGWRPRNMIQILGDTQKSML
ncbi:hypothetical protein HK103_002909, partial [Boothiomyces macroporosus]